MIFVSVPILLCLITLSIGSVMTMGIVAYKTLMECGFKAGAELLFFIAICSILLIVFLCVSIIIFAKRKTIVLKRITKISRFNDDLAIKKFKEFGNIGVQIKSLFAETLNISKKRAEVIVSLDSMIRILLNEIKDYRLLIDNTGIIQYISAGCRKTINLDESRIYGEHITTLIPEISFEEALLNMEKSHANYIINTDKGSVELQPIFNKNNVLFGVYVSLGKAALFNTNTTYTEPSPTSTTTTQLKNKKNWLDFLKLKK